MNIRYGANDFSALSLIIQKENVSILDNISICAHIFIILMKI